MVKVGADKRHHLPPRGVPGTGRRVAGRLLIGTLCVVAIVAAGVLVRDRFGSVRPPSPDTGDLTYEPRTSSGDPYRAFAGRSWWNTPLPHDAPLHAYGEAILTYLRTAPESGDGCLNLAGAGGSPWGQPIYWAGPGDTSYDVSGIADKPSELEHLRIPAGARPAATSDGAMTVFDLARGYVVLLSRGHYDEQGDEWSAGAATVTYLKSNGLHVRTGRSDDPRNLGTHRGNNGATAAVRFDEVSRGVISHVLKAAAGPEMARRAVFPMVGSDGAYAGDDPQVPPQGVRLRIKPSVDLETLVLHPQALVIARALQEYGVYLGDSAGTTALKLEDTVTEGRGQLWGVTAKDLCRLPFTSRYWDVIRPAYDPSRKPGRPEGSPVTTKPAG